MKKINWLLFTLVAVGFLLRFFLVWKYPPLLWDEASLGYNAYSILKTGRDEHGVLFPLIFKSFGDYKPGLYVYLTLPFVAILGLNEVSVRLPSVILGSLTPLFLYLLVKKITDKKKLATLSAVVLTFLPWSIHFSRGAWESNVLVFFLVLGSYLFIEGTFLFLIPFLLALLTYQGAKMMVPLIIFGLLFYCFSRLRKMLGNLRRSGLIVSFFLLFGMAVWYWVSFSGVAKNRLKVMSIFSYRRPENEIERFLEEDASTQKDLHYYVFHGEWLHFFRGILTRYFNHFSPEFLAFEGDWTNPRHSAPYVGVINHANYVFMLMGLIFFFSKRRDWEEYFFAFWLMVGPIPAALTRDIVSGVRSLAMIVPISFFVSYGLVGVTSLVKRKIPKLLLIMAILAFFTVDFVYWQDLYFTHMVKKSPRDWLYGYKEMIGKVNEYKKDLCVYITDFYGQPYIYYLFYNQYSPSKYQRQVNLVEGGANDVGRIEKLDTITFGSINWSPTIDMQRTYFVFAHDEILRSGVEKMEVFPSLERIGVIDNWSMFYGYKKE